MGGYFADRESRIFTGLSRGGGGGGPGTEMTGVKGREVNFPM